MSAPASIWSTVSNTAGICQSLATASARERVLLVIAVTSTRSRILVSPGRKPASTVAIMPAPTMPSLSLPSGRRDSAALTAGSRRQPS